MSKLLFLVIPGFVVFGAGCVQRTVTTSSGEVIYQEVEHHRLHQSEEKRREQVMERERELGW